MRDWLRATTECRELTEAVLQQAVRSWDGEQGSPDLLVVCQSTPDEFRAAEVDRWLGRWPLTRIVCCYGRWCDADGRTRSVWPLALRTPVALAIDRLQQELEVLNGRLAPVHVTASREEAFVFAYRCTAGSENANQPAIEIAVVSPDVEYAAMLRECCLAAALDTSTAESGSSAHRLVLWDADPLPSDRTLREAAVSTVVRRDPQATVVALLGSPQAVDVSWLRAAGVAAVLPKLAPIATLQACLHSLTCDPPPRTATRPRPPGLSAGS